MIEWARALEGPEILQALVDGNRVDGGQQVRCSPGLPSLGYDLGTWEFCATLGQGRWGQQRSRLRLVFADLSSESSPCANGDFRLGVLGVWGAQGILALTLVSSWAWALVCYLAGHCRHLDSRVKQRPNPPPHLQAKVLPGPLVVLHHLSLDQAVGWIGGIAGMVCHADAKVVGEGVTVVNPPVPCCFHC